VSIDGIDVGLFRVGDRVFAMENACPHAGDPLSEGALQGSVVTCRAHGWQFDVQNGFRPEDADGFPIPCFAVRVEQDEVWVDLGEVVNRPPRRHPDRSGE
jgi:nitrite reductase/ring-hydroxylating ferredoxin subunit